MNFNASPFNKLSRQLVQISRQNYNHIIFSFVVELSRHFVDVLKLFTSEIIVVTKLNLL